MFIMDVYDEAFDPQTHSASPKTENKTVSFK